MTCKLLRVHRQLSIRNLEVRHFYRLPEWMWLVASLLFAKSSRLVLQILHSCLSKSSKDLQFLHQVVGMPLHLPVLPLLLSSTRYLNNLVHKAKVNSNSFHQILARQMLWCTFATAQPNQEEWPTVSIHSSQAQSFQNFLFHHNMQVEDPYNRMNCKFYAALLNILNQLAHQAWTMPLLMLSFLRF